MEKMPLQAPHETAGVPVPVQALQRSGDDWRTRLPTLSGSTFVLREFRSSDAPALLAAMSEIEVSRFISPPPSSVDGFAKFIAWADRQRMAGQYVCFAVVPRGSDAAAGLFQIRSLEPDFANAEWGFAVASEFWGKGLFADSAPAVINFAFEVLGSHRLEARAAVRNGRGNAALRKLGAVHEGVLRRSFLRDGEYLDQALWTILREEWREAKAVWGARVIIH
jgi:RimJ/RimL family protein N-acetyltransferase